MSLLLAPLLTSSPISPATASQISQTLATTHFLSHPIRSVLKIPELWKRKIGDREWKTERVYAKLKEEMTMKWYDFDGENGQQQEQKEEDEEVDAINVTAITNQLEHILPDIRPGQRYSKRMQRATGKINTFATETSFKILLRRQAGSKPSDSLIIAQIFADAFELKTRNESFQKYITTIIWKDVNVESTQLNILAEFARITNMDQQLITALNQRWSDPDFITYADISLQMRKIITDTFIAINPHTRHQDIATALILQFRSTVCSAAFLDLCKRDFGKSVGDWLDCTNIASRNIGMLVSQYVIEKCSAKADKAEIQFEIPARDPNVIKLRALMQVTQSQSTEVKNTKPFPAGFLAKATSTSLPLPVEKSSCTETKDSDDESDKETSDLMTGQSSSEEKVQAQFLRTLVQALKTKDEAEITDPYFQRLFTSVPGSLALASSLELKEYCAALMFQLIHCYNGIGSDMNPKSNVGPARIGAIISCLKHGSIECIDTIAREVWGPHMGVTGKLLLLECVRNSIFQLEEIYTVSPSTRKEQDQKAKDNPAPEKKKTIGRTRRWHDTTRSGPSSMENAFYKIGNHMMRSLMPPVDEEDRSFGYLRISEKLFSTSETLLIAILNTMTAICYCSGGSPDLPSISGSLFSYTLMYMSRHNQSMSPAMLQSVLHSLLTLVQIASLAKSPYLWTQSHLSLWCSEVKVWTMETLSRLESSLGEQKESMGKIATFVLVAILEYERSAFLQPIPQPFATKPGDFEIQMPKPLSVVQH